jgi:predicted nucleic acid-binding protein
MSVLDASAVVELLLGTELGRAVAARVSDPAADLSAPHLLDVEVAQALRRYARDRLLTPREAAAALDDLRALDIERHGHEALLDRVWALRDNLTAYDAVYVALAEALGTTLITCDRKLARSPGMASRIALVS